MQYGSIGWSVGATLGYAQSVPSKRVIACIGDGSFQVSTPSTLKLKPPSQHHIQIQPSLLLISIKFGYSGDSTRCINHD